MHSKMVTTALFIAPSENGPAKVRTRTYEYSASESMTWLDQAAEIGADAQRVAETHGWELVSITLTAVWEI